ncbi:hypothetical protein Ahy_A07g032355 [Arachis hypogaea]|uniref:Uncharacterized protein n=1 Tax=Arachis hypogaea TaxID=3818 RepID=A0A445C6R8_ARAHY|nr:hypothetical protein Ahy_A07g032355 [Arachis hypogaea]
MLLVMTITKEEKKKKKKKKKRRRRRSKRRICVRKEEGGGVGGGGGGEGPYVYHETIKKNKVKLSNHVKKLPPIIKITYNHHINLIPGQSLWEVSKFNKPPAPKVKRPPKKLKIKRKMNSDEKYGGGKRSRLDIKKNDNTHLKRPAKLPARRGSSPSTSSTTVNPLQGASLATTSRIASLMKFVPTLSFKAPRKKI